MVVECVARVGVRPAFHCPLVPLLLFERDKGGNGPDDLVFVLVDAALDLFVDFGKRAILASADQKAARLQQCEQLAVIVSEVDVGDPEVGVFCDHLGHLVESLGDFLLKERFEVEQQGPWHARHRLPVQLFIELVNTKVGLPHCLGDLQLDGEVASGDGAEVPDLELEQG